MGNILGVKKEDEEGSNQDAQYLPYISPISPLYLPYVSPNLHPNLHPNPIPNRALTLILTSGIGRAEERRRAIEHRQRAAWFGVGLGFGLGIGLGIGLENGSGHAGWAASRS